MNQIPSDLARLVLVAVCVTGVLVLWIRFEPVPMPPVLQTALALLLLVAWGAVIAAVRSRGRRSVTGEHE